MVRAGEHLKVTDTILKYGRPIVQRELRHLEKTVD